MHAKAALRHVGGRVVTRAPVMWLLDVRCLSQTECWEFLSSSEQLCSKRYILDAGRRTYIVTRAALRCALSSMTGINPRQLVLEFGSWGKPFISAQVSSIPLHFSISHSDWLSVIAISYGNRVGVDIEKRRYVPEAVAIAKSCLGNTIALHLETLEHSSRDAAFLKFWTAAEAFAKATGLGWLGHGGRIALHASGPSASDLTFPLSHKPAPGLAWSIQELDLGPDHVGAVVLECPPHELGRVLIERNLQSLTDFPHCSRKRPNSRLRTAA